MEKLVMMFLFVLLSFFNFGCFADKAIDDFYEAQFQCNSKAERFVAVRQYDKLNTTIWTVVSDFKTSEISKNTKIEYPHKRFILHYVRSAVFTCGGGAIEGPQNYEEAQKPDKDSHRDAIILMRVNAKGIGEIARLDYEEMAKRGMNRDEAGFSYLHFAIAGSERPNCVSKMEDLLAGKTKLDIDKLCASEPEKGYKKDPAKVKADLDRLMSYWRKAAKEKEQTKAK